MVNGSLEKPGVYLIEHQATGRVYVGSAANLSKRWSRHRKDLAAGTHKNRHLQATWLRDGPGAFLWRILAIIQIAELVRVEQAVIDHYDATNPSRGFNKAPTAGRSPGSPTRSAAWRATMREVMLAQERGYKVGDRCAKGHIIDGTQVRRRERPDGSVRIGLRCQECTRLDSLRQMRRWLGIPEDWPKGKHYNRRAVVPNGKPSR